jgi:DME family drug/metabolite transporter
MRNKFFLPVLLLFSFVLDDILAGFVMGQISPLIVMPIWFGSDCCVGVIPFLVMSKKQQRLQTLIIHWRICLGFYFFTALSSFAWFSTVYNLGLSGGTVLVQFYHLLVIGWGLFVLKESLSHSSKFGIVAVFMGLIMFSAGGFGQYDLSAILIAFLMAVGYAGSIITKKYAAGKVDHNMLVTLRAFIMFLVASAIGLKLGVSVVSYTELSTELWVAMIVGGAVGAGLNHHLSLAVLKYISLSIYSVIEMLSPIIVVICGVLLYGDHLSDLQMVACGFVLLGKAVILFAKR